MTPASKPARRARIVCTLGPATATAERLRQLIEAGMGIARLNLSHGNAEDHIRTVEQIREADTATGVPIAILADLQGPKVRLGSIRGGTATLVEESEFVLDRNPDDGDETRASTTHAALADDVRTGDTLFIDDGRIELQVQRIDSDRVQTRVVVGGEISDRKGVNVPSTRLSLPVLGDKDRSDLEMALRAGVDWIALSFVRSADDAEVLRAAMREVGTLRPIIAKIETPQAVDELEAITRAFNGIMVARGDLGLETPLERLPSVQRRAIDLARDQGVPAIVATQMLDSMIESPTPTRAEVADVATAISDGADAVMLSGETSVGRHPIRATAQMRRIIEATEADPRRNPLPIAVSTRASDALARAAIELALELKASALCAFTASGNTARSLARHRASVPILALTPRPEVVRALSLTWGVDTIHVPMIDNMDEMIALAEKRLTRSERFKSGETVILLAGSPMGVVNQTNLLRILQTQ